MWCQHCRQDVPGINADHGPRCIRCGEAFAPAHAIGVAATASNGLDLSAPPEVSWLSQDEEDWALADEIRQAQRILATTNVRLGAVAGDRSSQRLDLPESPLSLPAWIPTSTVSHPVAPRRRRSQGIAFAIAWFMLSIGLMGFVCGAVLLAWAYFAGNNQLWSLGLPVALIGQAALVIGFVLQTDRLREDSSETAEQLQSVDQRILDLRQSATLLNNTHSQPATAFYAHLAEGASPHILLADLKGQLDLLALRMSKG